MPRLQIVGGGRMGEALLAGLIGAEWAPADDFLVVEPLDQRADELRAAHPGVRASDRPEPCEGAVLAVKPDHVASAGRGVADAGVERLLSIAAGVSLATLEGTQAAGTPVVRAMPNTPALIGEGAAAIAAGSAATADDLVWAEEILSAVGSVVRLSESHLDAVTGLSGSGPAYVFLVVEALVEAGVHAGLPRPVSHDLAVQTLLGSARLLAETDEPPAALRAQVTSPGGTTAAGLRVLEQAGVRAAFLDAVDAATMRSRELGGDQA